MRVLPPGFFAALILGISSSGLVAFPVAAFAQTEVAASTAPSTMPTPETLSTSSPTPLATSAPSPAPTPTSIPAPTPVPVLGANKFAGKPGDRPPLELDAVAAVSYALGHAPALLSQRATVYNLDSSFTKARAGEYPTATAQLQNQIAKSANQPGQFAQFGISPSSNFSENTAQLGSTYQLYNGGLQLTAEQAKKQLMSAQFELRRQEEQTAINVANAFYALAADRGIVALDDKDVAFQQSLLDSARAEEAVGRVAGVDILKAEVAVARSSSALVQARTNEQNDRENLAVTIGAPTMTLFDVPATLPEPKLPPTPAVQLETIAKMNRPEIAEARANLDVSKLTDASVDNDLRPVITLNGSFGTQVSPTQFVQEQQSIDESNAAALASYASEKALFPTATIPAPVLLPPVDRHVPGFWQFNILSTFTIPLFDYGQRAASHHAARAEIDSSLAGLYNAYDQVDADVDAAQRNIDAAGEKLRLAKLSADLGVETARIAQLQYKNGLISFTDVTQTEQTSLSAENDLLAARVQYVTAVIKLRIALAPPSPVAAADLRGL